MNQDTEPRIHVAISPWDLTDDYNRHAGVTLLSFLDHCPNCKVTAHILYDAKLSHGKEQKEEKNKACYQKIADRYTCDIKYHPITPPNWIEEIPGVKKWTQGMFLRLFLPDILQSIDKIIYLDCDVIVSSDMREFWNTPLNDSYLAAVPDSGFVNLDKKRRRYYKQKNIPIDSYFCSGVLILNIYKLQSLEKPFTETILSYLYENRDLPFPDQDMLNWFCQGKYVQLPEKMNVFSSRVDAMNFVGDGIIHYAGTDTKPWVKYNGDIDDIYWRYLVETPWCDNKMDMVRYLRSPVEIEKTLSLFSKDFLSLLDGNKIKKAIVTTHLMLDICKSIAMSGMNIIKKPLIAIGIVYKS